MVPRPDRSHTSQGCLGYDRAAYVSVPFVRGTRGDGPDLRVGAVPRFPGVYN